MIHETYHEIFHELSYRSLLFLQKYCFVLSAKMKVLRAHITEQNSFFAPCINFSGVCVLCARRVCGPSCLFPSDQQNETKLCWDAYACHLRTVDHTAAASKQDTCKRLACCYNLIRCADAIDWWRIEFGGFVFPPSVVGLFGFQGIVIEENLISTSQRKLFRASGHLGGRQGGSRGYISLVRIVTVALCLMCRGATFPRPPGVVGAHLSTTRVPLLEFFPSPDVGPQSGT